MSFKHYYGMCPRCGQDARDRRHPLCLDCRDTMSDTDAQDWLEQEEERDGEADAA